jgi:3-oxoacyl-[acyl-carrier-protein] synthase II
MSNRVVITGIGVLAANAASATELAAAMREGRSGIRRINRFDPGLPFSEAGEVEIPELDPALDRVSQLAVLAAMQAVVDSGLDRDGWRSAAGVSIGTSRGPANSLERLLRPRDGSLPTPYQSCGQAQQRLELLDEIPFHSIARNISRRLGLCGPASTITMACVSSSLAVGRAVDAIRRDRVPIMIAGGADALSKLSFSGFSVLRAMTHSCCRPFDRRRDGLVLGEGAGMLVLEDYRHARRRGARIYAELCGWGTAGDGHHSTRPDPRGRGLCRAMEGALRQAGIAADSVDHVNLHGTGTPANDAAECQAMHQVFGARAEQVPVNSLKPMLGHTLGAAGVLELSASILAMLGGFLPPTLNHEQADPECPLNVVSGDSRDHRTRALLSTKSAFGGANVSIVARRI